ncbi:MAG: hypothetical protein ACK48F_10900 [Chryseotalea sp.]|jgi:hypothetical protein
MKLKLFIVAIVAILFTTVAFTVKQTYQPTKATAEVDQEQGLYVFIRSKPVKEYEYLGKVNMPEVVWSGKPKEMMNIAVNRTTKQYPNANALIFQSDNFSKVDAIRIKD